MRWYVRRELCGCVLSVLLSSHDAPQARLRLELSQQLMTSSPPPRLAPSTSAPSVAPAEPAHPPAAWLWVVQVVQQPPPMALPAACAPPATRASCVQCVTPQSTT